LTSFERLYARERENFVFDSLIYVGNESWLSESVTNGMLDCFHSYNIYRKDLPHKQRGGGIIGMVVTNTQSHSIPLPF